MGLREFGGREISSHVPGQQVVDAAEGMLSDAAQHFAQPAFRIDSVEACRSEQGGNGGGRRRHGRSKVPVRGPSAPANSALESRAAWSGSNFIRPGRWNLVDSVLLIFGAVRSSHPRLAGPPVLSVFSPLQRGLHWNCCLSSARMFVREASVPFFRTRGCGVNLVFTLHQAAAITARRNVAQTNVAWHRAKQGNACSD
jgi:hypothetical protein